MKFCMIVNKLYIWIELEWLRLRTRGLCMRTQPPFFEDARQEQVHTYAPTIKAKAVCQIIWTLPEQADMMWPTQ